MSETAVEQDLGKLLERAKFLRRRIQDLRIDYPEAADARSDELCGVEAQIAVARALRSPPSPPRQRNGRHMSDNQGNPKRRIER